LSAPTFRWHVYPDAGALIRAVVATIATQSKRAIDARGEFALVLAGGTTPRRVYAGLAELDLAWDRWEVFFGDERCLPLADPQRNDTMARRVWLDQVPIPPERIHAIPAELGPAAGADAYGREIANVGAFDLTLLGLGEDGHTASLFPGHWSGDTPDAPDVLAVEGAPKPPAERISLSAARLGRSRVVFMLVLGAAKRVAVENLRAKTDLPVHRIRPPDGVDIHLDRAATRRPV
jgi:6-phosphogluconolactonase